MMLPEFVTPEQLAEHLGASPRHIRELASDLGARAKFGRRVVLFPEHVQILMEAAKCPSNSPFAAASGTQAGPLPEGDFGSLVALRTKKSRSASQQKRKPKPGNVVSLDRGRG